MEARLILLLLSLAGLAAAAHLVRFFWTARQDHPVFRALWLRPYLFRAVLGVALWQLVWALRSNGGRR